MNEHWRPILRDRTLRRLGSAKGNAATHAFGVPPSSSVANTDEYKTRKHLEAPQEARARSPVLGTCDAGDGAAAVEVGGEMIVFPTHSKTPHIMKGLWEHTIHSHFVESNELRKHSRMSGKQALLPILRRDTL